MITLIPLQKVIAAFAIVYAILISVVSTILQFTGINSLFIAIKGAFILELFILVFFMFGWRRLWLSFPALNRWVYPDLNGKWKVSIHWKRGNENGTKMANAHIKQDFFRFSMQLVSDESESETLMVKPQRDPESARPILYYIYRNESAQGVEFPQPPHKGAAILKLDINDHNLLKGNYFTDRATSGHFELQREKV